MDYNKLTNDSLKEMLSDREIKYNENTNKEGLVNLLENNDEQKEVSEFGVEDNQNIGNPKAGAITTIVLSAITLLFGVWIALGFIGLIIGIMFYGGSADDSSGSAGAFIFLIIFDFIMLFMFFIGPIISIVVNVRYIKGKNNKVSAGVWGLLFGGIIGGILTLCGV